MKKIIFLSMFLILISGIVNADMGHSASSITPGDFQVGTFKFIGDQYTNALWVAGRSTFSENVLMEKDLVIDGKIGVCVGGDLNAKFSVSGGNERALYAVSSNQAALFEGNVNIVDLGGESTINPSMDYKLKVKSEDGNAIMAIAGDNKRAGFFDGKVWISDVLTVNGDLNAVDIDADRVLGDTIRARDYVSVGSVKYYDGTTWGTKSCQERCREISRDTGGFKDESGTCVAAWIIFSSAETKVIDCDSTESSIRICSCQAI